MTNDDKYIYLAYYILELIELLRRRLDRMNLMNSEISFEHFPGIVMYRSSLYTFTIYMM